jgi:hypothetical protein
MLTSCTYSAYAKHMGKRVREWSKRVFLPLKTKVVMREERVVVLRCRRYISHFIDDTSCIATAQNPYSSFLICNLSALRLLFYIIIKKRDKEP